MEQRPLTSFMFVTAKKITLKDNTKLICVFLHVYVFAYKHCVYLCVHLVWVFVCESGVHVCVHIFSVSGYIYCYKVFFFTKISTVLFFLLYLACHKCYRQPINNADGHPSQEAWSSGTHSSLCMVLGKRVELGKLASFSPRNNIIGGLLTLSTNPELKYH